MSASGPNFCRSFLGGMIDLIYYIIEMKERKKQVGIVRTMTIIDTWK
jgi:hypothetical protein